MLINDLPTGAPYQRMAPDFAPRLRSKKLHFQSFCIDRESEEIACEIKAAHTTRQQYLYGCSGAKYFLDGYVSFNKLRMSAADGVFRQKLEDYDEWLTGEHALAMLTEANVQSEQVYSADVLDHNPDDNDGDEDESDDDDYEPRSPSPTIEPPTSRKIHRPRIATDRLIDHAGEVDERVQGDGEDVGFSDDDEELDDGMSENSDDRDAVVDYVSESSHYTNDEEDAVFTSDESSENEDENVEETTPVEVVHVVDQREQTATPAREDTSVDNQSQTDQEMTIFDRQLFSIYGMPIDEVTNLPPNLRKLIGKIRGKRAPRTPVGYAIEFRECQGCADAPDLFREGVSRSATSHGYCDSCADFLRARETIIPNYIRHRMAGTVMRAEDVRRTGILMKEVSSCDFKKSLDQGELKEWYDARITQAGAARLGATSTEKDILNAIQTRKLHGFIQVYITGIKYTAVQVSLYTPLEKRAALAGMPPIIRHMTISRDDLQSPMKEQAMENDDVRTPRNLLVSAYESTNCLYTCEMIRFLMSLGVMAYDVIGVWEYDMKPIFRAIILKMVEKRMECKAMEDILGDVFWKLASFTYKSTFLNLSMF